MQALWVWETIDNGRIASASFFQRVGVERQLDPISMASLRN